MSIFKVALSVIEARVNNAAEAKARKANERNEKVNGLNPYDKSIVGQETSIGDGFTLALRKQPLGHCEITVSHDKGLELSKVVRYNRAFTNVTAAYDCGVFNETIEELIGEINNLLPQRKIAVIVI